MSRKTLVPVSNEEFLGSLSKKEQVYRNYKESQRQYIEKNFNKLFVLEYQHKGVWKSHYVPAPFEEIVRARNIEQSNIKHSLVIRPLSQKKS